MAIAEIQIIPQESWYLTRNYGKLLITNLCVFCERYLI